MKSNHIARNASIIFGGLKAELFFNAINCDHIADNYHALFSSHDVKFVEIVNLLKGDVFTELIPKSNKFLVISKYKGKYYKTIVVPSVRKDLNDYLYLVVISCYICTHKHEKDAYENYIKQTKSKYKR